MKLPVRGFGNNRSQSRFSDPRRSVKNKIRHLSRLNDVAQCLSFFKKMSLPDHFINTSRPYSVRKRSFHTRSPFLNPDSANNLITAFKNRQPFFISLSILLYNKKTAIFQLFRHVFAACEGAKYIQSHCCHFFQNYTGLFWIKFTK